MDWSQDGKLKMPAGRASGFAVDQWRRKDYGNVRAQKYSTRKSGCFIFGLGGV